MFTLKYLSRSSFNQFSRRSAHFDFAKFKLTPEQIQKISKHQSPVNINEESSDVVNSNFSIEFNYKPIKSTKFQEIDSTLRLHNDDLGTIKVTDIDGKGPYLYRGYEVRFNGPSEHRINNKAFNMEMQIFHDLVEGPNMDQYDEKKAVVSLLFSIGESNHHTMEHLKTDKLDTIDEADLGEIFRESDNKHFYHYKGTLTVPPTHQFVNWFVLRHVLPIKKSLIQNLESHCIHQEAFHNFTTLQHLYGRKIGKNFK